MLRQKGPVVCQGIRVMSYVKTERTCSMSGYKGPIIC